MTQFPFSEHWLPSDTFFGLIVYSSLLSSPLRAEASWEPGFCLHGSLHGKPMLNKFCMNVDQSSLQQRIFNFSLEAISNLHKNWSSAWNSHKPFSLLSIFFSICFIVLFAHLCNFYLYSSTHPSIHHHYFWTVPELVANIMCLYSKTIQSLFFNKGTFLYMTMAHSWTFKVYYWCNSSVQHIVHIQTLSTDPVMSVRTPSPPPLQVQDLVKICAYLYCLPIFLYSGAAHQPSCRSDVSIFDANF